LSLRSLRKEFLNFGRKFFREEWGGRAVDEKALSFHHLLIKHIKNCTTRLVQLGMSTVRKDKLV